MSFRHLLDVFQTPFRNFCCLDKNILEKQNKRLVFTRWIAAPSKRHIPARIDEEPGRSGEFRVEFTPTEVGSHLVEVSIAGQKLPAGPLVAKVYNSSLIQVTDVPSAVVGHACQFRGEYRHPIICILSDWCTKGLPCLSNQNYTVLRK